MIRTVKHPEERKLEIILAARELFLKDDYEKTTMQDVMSKLGIAKGTIYHYFESKDQLLDAVIEKTVDEYVENLQNVLVQSSGNALERIRILISAGNMAEEQHELIDQLHKPGNVALHSRLLAVIFKRIAPLFAKVIEQGCEEGLFKTQYPLETAELMIAGVQCLFDVGVYPWKEEDLIRRSKAVPALMEAQLSAPKGSFDFLRNIYR